MNGKVKVTWIMVCTIAHSLMVHARVSEVRIHFTFMYKTDHIFSELPIKDLLNEDGKPTMLFKLATGKKPSVSHLCVLFLSCLVLKATAHLGTKASNMRHQAQRSFLRYLCCNFTASKRVSCVRIRHKEDHIFLL